MAYSKKVIDKFESTLNEPEKNRIVSITVPRKHIIRTRYISCLLLTNK